MTIDMTKNDNIETLKEQTKREFNSLNNTLDSALAWYRTYGESLNSIEKSDELTDEGKQQAIADLHFKASSMKKDIEELHKNSLDRGNQLSEALTKVEAFPKLDPGSLDVLTYQANVIQSRFSMSAGTVEGFNELIKDVLASEPEVRQAFLDIAHELKREAEENGNLIRFNEAYRQVSNSMKSDEQLANEALIGEIAKYKISLNTKYVAFNRNIDQLIGSTGLKKWGKEPVKQKSNSLW